MDILYLAREWCFSARVMEIFSSHASEVGYSAEVLRHGFLSMFRSWGRESFYSLFHSELSILLSRAPLEAWLDFSVGASEDVDRRSILSGFKRRRIYLVLSSTVPSASFQDVLLSLILPFEVLVRPSRNFLGLYLSLIEDLRHVAPSVGERITVSASRSDVEVDDLGISREIRADLERCDLVNVSGCDATVLLYQTVCEWLGKPVLMHGHRISVIAIFRGEYGLLTSSDYLSMAWDVSLWDQLGCLSPRIVYFEGEEEEADAFSRRLCESLDEVGVLLPEGEVGVDRLSQYHSAICMALYDGVRVHRGCVNHDYVFVHSAGENFSPILHARCLNVYVTRDALMSSRQVSPYGQGFCTRVSVSVSVRRMLSCSGFNYFCTFGHLQSPPLDWKQEGVGRVGQYLRHMVP